ncbi:hypothetical protein ACQJBY_049642 [Aegilops geniculata]
MPTVLFNRRRGRESATSARRYSIRGAGGGSSLMARAVMGRRRRPDRISALSDDLLLLVLRRLDIRTAVGTTALSRRWACLRGELPILDLSVDAMLPPRYHRWVQLHGVVGKGGGFQYDLRQVSRELMPNRRYEHRAMRALTRSVQSFLDAGTAGRRRRISRLRLEFFVTPQSTECMNRLIGEAIDACGVDDLQVVAKPIFWRRGAVHTFASHGLCKEPSASRLQSLKLGGCMIPPLHEYGALTRLVLQDIPESTPLATYQGVFTSCQQLQVLHLISCRCSGGVIFVDAPMSKIKELVVDECRFTQLRLRALPNLQSLASLSLGPMVFLESASFPCLTKFNLTSCLGVTMQGFRQYLKRHLKIDHESLLENMPELSILIVRISGPYRWIVPSPSTTILLPNLRRLLVADVPSSWDVSWPRLLLEAAPSLEVLHLHIAATCTEDEDEPSDDIRWKPTTLLRHQHLEEFVMVGYEGTERQIYLVKFVVGVCTLLRQVSIFKNGHARNKGHWDWELVTQQHSWTNQEKDNTLKHIMDGVSPLSPAAPVKLVFG